jgi:hypothetical protein
MKWEAGKGIEREKEREKIKDRIIEVVEAAREEKESEDCIENEIE